MEDSQVFVGIDVSKSCLDVAARPTGEVWQVPNDADGFGALAQRLAEIGPCGAGGHWGPRAGAHR